ncbi:uncharacterized protein B0I36DRAFT_159014 [Microdochium trichocladiopsis]|uniref:Uncharacterized protein n=1 Tax=Microdochium trichocladiopsis TaxID=1682393 RepID=A0A9P8Y2R3_9PEZI|nr:uncharacterized protein B0I36DRAFT_159014 [Microdochium trichocladiopsis]KAH7026474.1 hypothetical protein B0I36DRAFT_159014 [Microdochium trichocladiopsis]
MSNMHVGARRAIESNRLIFMELRSQPRLSRRRVAAVPVASCHLPTLILRSGYYLPVFQDVPCKSSWQRPAQSCPLAAGLPHSAQTSCSVNPEQRQIAMTSRPGRTWGKHNLVEGWPRNSKNRVSLLSACRNPAFDLLAGPSGRLVVAADLRRRAFVTLSRTSIARRESTCQVSQAGSLVRVRRI